LHFAFLTDIVLLLFVLCCSDRPQTALALNHKQHKPIFMVKFHYVTLALETNTVVEEETVIKLNQTKYAMAFLDLDDTPI
jgi:hypothetical protein